MLAKLGHVIRLRRKMLGISHFDVGSRLGFSEGEMMQIEDGNHDGLTVEHLAEMASILGLPAWELLEQAEKLTAH